CALYRTGCHESCVIGRVEFLEVSGQRAGCKRIALMGCKFHCLLPRRVSDPLHDLFGGKRLALAFDRVLAVGRVLSEWRTRICSLIHPLAVEFARRVVIGPWLKIVLSGLAEEVDVVCVRLL